LKERRKGDIEMSHLKGKLLLAMIILLILDFSFLSFSNVNQSSAQLVPLIYVDPPMVDDPSKGVGSTFKIDINIANVSETESLFGWQVNMTFNPAVVNTTNAQIVFGDFLSMFGGTVTAKDVDNIGGSLLISCSFSPPYPDFGASYDGWLASITFKVRATGAATLLRFVSGTKLKTVVSGVLVDIGNFKTADGGFDNRPVDQNALPVASFSVEPLAADHRGVVNFDASASYDPDTWLMNYHWDYGDGFSDVHVRGVNLTALTAHTYTQNGTYPVTLTVKDYNNTAATDSKTATVQFDIAITEVTSPQIMVMSGTPVQVDVTAVNNGDFLETFNVSAYANQDFIGKQTVTNLAPSTQTTLHFTWDTTGASLGGYVLKANATIVLGEANTTNNEYVNGLITVAETNIFNYPVIVGGHTFIVQVNSTSSLGDLNLISSEKKISLHVSGEMGTNAFCNITIPMDLLNVSTASAWVVNFDGNTWPSTISQNSTHYFIYIEYTHSTHIIEIIGKTVATPPVAQFTPSKTTALAGESISFDASASTDPDGTIQSWTWNFDDGETGNGETVHHSFTSFGSYDVTLTVKDDEDLSNSTTVTITIIDYPVANFTYTPKPPIADQAVTFDASASQPKGGSIASYSWKFGDGQTNTSAVVMHKYTETGTFTVNLTVTDSEQLSNSVTATITVIGYPTANFTFTPQEPFVNQTVNFGASTSQPNGGTITNYNWKFGDGQNSTGASTSHSFSEEGTYRVELTVTDSEQLTDTTSILIQVELQPESNLSISATPTILTLGQTTIITGALEPALEGITVTMKYKLETATTWTFLDNETTNANGQYSCNWTPASTGTYEVKASWQGNPTTQPSESQIELIIVYEAEKQPILQDPNATLMYAAAAIAIILVASMAIYLLKIRR
jgi:PKD repeat protein